MKKKGFTLVELLAVITVLSIVLIIAIPKINKYTTSNKEKAFFLSAKSILRKIEYENIENLSYSSTNLSSLNLKNLSSYDYDLDNSYVYMVNETLYINLVGIGKFNDYYLCAISSQSKSYEMQFAPCAITGGTVVHINLYGGNMSNEIDSEYLAGTEIELGTPTKQGYTFIGWEITSDGDSLLVGNTLTIGHDETTVRANWGQ